ncbi:MAG TPA: lactonase family protein, partial [Pyrinomonadaceae bacterium]|nr:lactonase family protein [Pyrinomonadaceae bacterium]
LLPVNLFPQIQHLFMQHEKSLDRRQFLRLAGAGAAVLSGIRNVRSQDSKDMLLYVGTYTAEPSKSEGIYLFRFDGRNGRITAHKVVSGVEEPSFLAIDRRRRFLYAVNETLDYQGQKSGAVSAFAIDQSTGSLSFLNKQPSMGGAPCHISISNDGRFALVANYIGGNVAVLPIEKNGSLGRSVDVRQHEGKGTKKQQEAPHAHSVLLDDKDRFVFVNDLGTDKVVIYEFDRNTGKLSPNGAQPFYMARPGAGPRHFKIHPNGRFAFVVNELDMTVTSLNFDAKLGKLSEVQTLSTIPASYAGTNSCADLHISPDGNFLYASNRGHDSIVSYRIDPGTGSFQLIEHVPTGGKTPRNFAIDPTGSYLLAANQRSDSIVVFGIDRRTGKLSATGNTVSVPSPVCLLMIPDITK